MKKYTINLNFTDTIEAENEDKAFDIFWERLNFTAVATLENVKEVEEDD